MTMTTAVPVFLVGNVEQTAQWYRDCLGFAADPFPDQPPYEFAILSRDRAEIMLQRIEGYRKAATYHLRSTGTWDAYFSFAETGDGSNVRAFYESVRDKVTIVKPLYRPFYGTMEFEVEDCNGYILVFSETIE